MTRVRGWVEDWSHLTWNGRASAVYYALRRLFVAPAASEDRCVMGGPIGEHVRCPRPAIGETMWCRRHTRSVS